MAVIVQYPAPTVAPHRPDDILEAAKGQGLTAVMVIGDMLDGSTWVSASQSDAARMLLMLELAKRELLRCAAE